MPSTGKEEVNKLAQNLAKLVEIFRQGGKASDFNWWGSEHPNSIFNPSHGYQAGQSLFDEVVQGILKLNPNMLSEYEVQTKLMFDFLQEQTSSAMQAKHLSNQSLVSEAKRHLSKLIEFKASQDVDIPIGNLWLEGEPAKLGDVTFMKVTKEELEQWKKEYFWSEGAPDVGVVARVKAPGDLGNALSYARNHVDLTLNVLRAFCFPFGRESDMWRVGVVGDIISAASTPVRINNRHFAAQLGPGVAGIELRKHVLSKLEQPQRELVNKLILKAENSRSKMERKLLNGIHWLAEATKPDTNRAKFVKISIALETLIGGGHHEGITAMLAERAAFIAGRDLRDLNDRLALDYRMAIDKNIRYYYKIRSEIIHGSEKDVSLDAIDGFGQLVRRIAIALLEMLAELGDAIPNVKELEKWVKRQRYTLATNNSKEATNAAG